MPLSRETFELLKEAILSRRPVLRMILSEYGDKPIKEYVEHRLVSETKCPFPSRQHEFFSVFRVEVERIFGREIADRAVEQMKTCFSVSTADHHGPLTSPFFINPNLLCAAVSEMKSEVSSDLKKEFLITFPCANVSFNNSSFPRGLLYHLSGMDSSDNTRVVTERLSFVSAKNRLSSLYGAPAYRKEDVMKFYPEIDRQMTEFRVPRTLVKKLRSVVSEIYENEDVMLQSNFSDQMTLSNFFLWRKFFPDGQIPCDLLYLSMENIATDLLLQFHIKKGTILDQVIFDAQFEPFVKRHFNGIQGAFDLERRQGTYLFWGLLPGRNYIIALEKVGNELVGDDGKFRVPYTREAIAQALRDKKLVPGLLLDYMVLVFYYGLRCLGGFNQVNYLTSMKNAWISMMREIGIDDGLDGLEKVETDGLAGDMTIAYITDGFGKFYGATGLDLVLYQNADSWRTLKDMTQEISVSESLFPLFAEFYPIVYSAEERVLELSAVTSDDIIEYLGLQRKFKACVKM